MKRRHFSPASPTVAAAAAAKKGSFFPCSEERKLDTTVLQFQNQKLSQQLEVQKFEYSALENKFKQLENEQGTYDDTLVAVNKSWDKLVDGLGSMLSRTKRDANDGQNDRCSQGLNGGSSFSIKDDLLLRLLETGATENSSGNVSSHQKDGTVHKVPTATEKILKNILSGIDMLWNVNSQITSSLLDKAQEDDFIQQLHKSASDSHMELKSLRQKVGDLHLNYRLLIKDVRANRDNSAKYKAHNRRLAGELDRATVELKESRHDLSVLKSQRDNAHGTPFLLPALGSNCVTVDGVRDRQKEQQELDEAHREMLGLASSRLLELQCLHEKRKEIFSKLHGLKNILHVKCNSSNFLLLHDQLEKSKVELDNYQVLLEKLQIEKDSFLWREKDAILKTEIADISHRESALAESQIVELEKSLLKQVDEKMRLEAKLEDASREPGRKDIISEFKSLVTSLPKDMEIMQLQLTKCKEDASEIHSLRAEARSLSNILNRKETDLKTLSRKSADQAMEIQKQISLVRDLEQSDHELKLFLEMYKRESTDSRDVLWFRDLEYKAWARVQTIKSSLDEHSLELRVKAANEAEAISQQRLATAEAEIADLRQRLEVSRRETVRLSEVLKSKCEEGEAYLSEIESIGQAYEDLQNQNQNLLQQITERDDYNIKLVLESVKERHVQIDMEKEIQKMNKGVEQANVSLGFYNLKVIRLEDQIRNLADQVGKVVEDGRQNFISLDNIKRRMSEVQGESEHLNQSLDETHNKIEMSRRDMSTLQIELEEERFNNNRMDEDVEVKIRKAARLKARTQGSVLEKLQQELREYKGILKCSICDDRQKEVVISKCYHLLCNPCVQRTLENRQRKCPVCSMSFGPNDIKPIYI